MNNKNFHHGSLPEFQSSGLGEARAAAQPGGHTQAAAQGHPARQEQPVTKKQPEMRGRAAEQSERWAVIHTPAAFHGSFPVGARPQLKLFKDLWFWLFMLVTVPSIVAGLILLRVSSPISGFFGEGLVVAVGLAAVEVAVVLVLLRFLPIFRGTPKRLVFLALSWGGFSSVVLASALLSPPWLSVAEKMGWYAHSASLAAAVPEEVVKALGVLMLLWIGRAWWNRPWHGLVAGMLVGLGFDAFENAIYAVTMGITHPASDMAGAIEIFGMRAVLGPLLHVLFTGLFGWALGQLMYEGYSFSRAKRWSSLLLWGSVAIGGHYFWNVLPENQDAMVLNLGLKLIVYAILVVSLITIVVRQNRRVLPLQRAGLEPAVTMCQRLR